MTWTEFLAALVQRGMTQAEFARASGYSKHTVNRWQHRVRGVPAWVARWLTTVRVMK